MSTPKNEEALEYPLSDRPTRASIDALRQTLAQVEEQAGLAPDDVCLVELKRILLNRIADLEGSYLAGNSPNDLAPTVAAVDLATSPAEQPAVAVAVDLAITLLTEYLPPRSLEPVEVASPIPNGSRSHAFEEGK